MLSVRGTINNILAWHLLQILFPQKKYQGSFSTIWDQIKYQVTLFSPTPSYTLILLLFLHLVREIFLQLQKLFCVSTLELKKLSLDGSSQPEKKLQGCCKHITHLCQPPPLIHFNKICLFCYKSWFDFGEVKCPPLPKRNGTFYMSPLCPPLPKS